MILPVIGMIFFMIGQAVVIDGCARSLFLYSSYPRKYGHGKSGTRAHKHYKSTWTFFQRMLWIPVFAERYDREIRMLAYHSCIHYIFSILNVVIFLIDEFVLTEIVFWHYIFIGLFVFTCYRLFYLWDIYK